MSQNVLTQPVPTGAITKVATHGLPPTSRCCRCDAQAYAEAEIWDAAARARRKLEFCSHHFSMHLDGLIQTAVRIIDYRPFLDAQEKVSRVKDDRR